MRVPDTPPPPPPRVKGRRPRGEGLVPRCGKKLLLKGEPVDSD